MNACLRFPNVEEVAVSAGFASIRWTKPPVVVGKMDVFRPVAPEVNVLAPLGPYFPVRTFVRCSL
jgi:hypothetical protein